MIFQAFWCFWDGHSFFKNLLDCWFVHSWRFFLCVMALNGLFVPCSKNYSQKLQNAKSTLWILILCLHHLPCNNKGTGLTQPWNGQLSNSSQASENGGVTVIPNARITSDKEIMFSLAFACRCVIILFVNMIIQFFLNDIWLNVMGVQSGVLFTIH